MKRIDARFLGLLALLILAAAVFTGFEKSPVRKIPPIDSSSDSWPTLTFRDWAYFADATEIPPGLANRGSRIDGVEYRGAFTSGWFTARPKVEMLVAGFPHLPGNSLALELRDHEGRITRRDFDRVDPRDSWLPWTVDLPPSAVSFRIQAVDGESGVDGWLAVTEPFEPRFRPAFLTQTERAFLAFAIQAVLLIAIGLACAQCIRRGSVNSAEIPFLPLVTVAAVALAGYLAFWIYFAHPLAGRVFSWGICAAAVTVLFLPKPGWPRLPVNLSHPVFLAVVIGLFYIALLVLFEPPRLSFAAANRFADGMPSDNEIPRAFAERLANGQAPRALWGDWLSSDRPPLQSGWLLLTWPILQSLGFDVNTISTTGGICFQLLWVFAVWALSKNLGANSRQALAIPAALSFTGVFLLFSIFVWPKFAAASLVVAAWLLWFNARSANTRICYVIGGACAALGWLSHGGVAFSLLAVIPIFLPSRSDWAHRSPLRSHRWLLALGAFAVLAAPWVAYQRFYEPPGDRLLKWHLAGSMAIDGRSFLETVREAYGQIGFGGAWETRKQNLALLFHGDWSRLVCFDTSVKARSEIRSDELTYLVRSWSWWALGLVFPVFWLVRRRWHGAGPFARPQGAMLAWSFGGILVWIALMFVPNATMLHQGTLVTQLLSFTLLAWWAISISRFLFAAVSVVNTVWFAAVWVPSSNFPAGPLQAAPAIAAILLAALLLWVVVRAVVRLPAESGN